MRLIVVLGIALVAGAVLVSLPWFGSSGQDEPGAPAGSGTASKAGETSAEPVKTVAPSPRPVATDSASLPSPLPGSSPGTGGSLQAASSSTADPSSAQNSGKRSDDASVDAPERDFTASLLAGVDLSNPEVRAVVVAELTEREESRMELVRLKAERLGIPLRIDGPGNRVAFLHDFRGDEPLYRHTLNANAAISSGANLVFPSPYSLSGNGVRVGIWDGGSVRSTHQELTGRVTLRNSSAAVDDHATHVAGTIGASGAQAAAKGMASSVRIDSYDWNSDYAEMTAAGAASATDSTRIPISNHSYGYGAVAADMGRYEAEARSTDSVAVSLPFYLPFWAAGNEQTDLPSLGGFQSITFNGLAKNVLTVGAVNDAVSAGVRLPSAGTMSGFSSWGPCDDGRVKPDVVANGVGVYSSVGTGNAAYDTYDGTSMATPSAAGSSALLAQLYAREFSGQMIRASTLKALLIHTADDLGNPGPDYRFGWGLINVKAAADLILAHKASLASPKIVEGNVTNSAKTRTHTFVWDGVSPIRATLVWTDPAGVAQTLADSRTPNLVNNLDLRITAPNGSTVHNPFVMPFVGTWTTASMNASATTGKNNVDNVEQVRVAAPTQAGNYTVTVSVDGNVANTAQVYSLILSGGTTVAGNPPPSVTLTAPASGLTTLANQTIAVSANASDTVAGGGVGGVASVEFFAGATSLGADSTAPYSVNWVPQMPGVYTVTAVATDTEGASSTSGGSDVTVLSGSGAPQISSFSPTSGPAGSQVVLTGSNFANVSAVTFNGTSASQFTVDSLTQITATVPGTAGSGPLGVATSLGNGTSNGSFIVVQPSVLISQIYGGGGNAGAPLNADYVELYNRGNATVSLSGWSIQYASRAGTTWSVTALNGSIAPGRYYLVRLATGSIGTALPTPDAVGTASMSSSGGKVALSNSTTPFTGSSPAGQAGLQDFVGYGTANAFEGTAPAPAGSATLAAFRAGAGATDTGNNAADFTTASPNPRNSAGGASAPVITSAGTAGGTVGTAFSYQITASNGPTAFGAVGLPAGLSVNSTSGLISGTPSVAGTSNVTLSASNLAGAGNGTLALTIVPSGGGGNTTIFSENFTSITNGNSTSTSGSSSAWTGNTNFPTVSNAYQAGGSVKLGSDSAVGSITSRALDLGQNGGNFTLSFKVKGWTTVEGNITVTVGSLAARTVSYNSAMAGSFETKSLNFSGGTANMTVRIATTAKRAFIDDVVITSTAPATPVISLTGSPGTVPAIYGSPSSAPASFSVSGANMTAGILVTAPTGFEVSQTSGGTSGFAATQTVGSSGTIAPTTLWVRLAAGFPVGSYGGQIVATSAGALPVSVNLTASDVSARPVSITANDRMKAFGSVLSLGNSAFTALGLVGNETIGSVTLTAASGTAAYDLPGNHTITPSAATGGTFMPGNYDITYLAGTLTVTAPTFAEWIAGTQSGANASAGADPDGDGLANLVEYFMGLNAAMSDSSSVQSVAFVGNEVRLTYRRSKAAVGITATPESSTSLSGSSWSGTGVTDTLVSDEGAYEVRRATIPMGSGETKRFLRLRLTQP